MCFSELTLWLFEHAEKFLNIGGSHHPVLPSCLPRTRITPKVPVLSRAGSAPSALWAAQYSTGLPVCSGCWFGTDSRAPCPGLPAGWPRLLATPSPIGRHCVLLLLPPQEVVPVPKPFSASTQTQLPHQTPLIWLFLLIASLWYHSRVISELQPWFADSNELF